VSGVADWMAVAAVVVIVAAVFFDGDHRCRWDIAVAGALSRPLVWSCVPLSG
jgi:hypothetical protein